MSLCCIYNHYTLSSWRYVLLCQNNRKLSQMFFSKINQEKELENLSIATSKSPDTQFPGQNTTTYHCEIKSKLGWIAWKDREAGLFM